MSSSEPEKQALFNQTKAIVFYSTPHKGSHLAALNATSQMIIWPSVEVQELRESKIKHTLILNLTIHNSHFTLRNHN